MEPKLQIVFITNNYTPYSGGVVSSIKAAKSGLEAQGHSVAIITLDFEGKREADEEPGVFRLFCPIKFKYQGNHMAIPWRKRHQMKLLLQRLKPDIMHVHHPFLLGYAGMKLAKKFKIPLLFTFHTRYTLYSHYVPLPQGMSKKIIHYLVKKFCQQVDGIIAPTQSALEDIQESGITSEARIISSSIDHTFFTPFEKNTNDRFELLTVCRWTQEKNIPLLLNVMNELRTQNIHLTLVGYGNYKKELFDLAFNQLNLKNASFIEKPSRPELLRLYQKSDCFIFASQTETQGIVLAEAMASGLPVVALDAPGSRDIIKNGENGFCVSSQEKMVSHILELALNPNLVAQLKLGAQKTASSYSQKGMTSKLLSYYKALLNRA